VLESLGDRPADLDALDLPVICAHQFLLDLFDELLQGLGADRPLETCLLQAGQRFLAVVRHARAVLLDHRQFLLMLDMLIGREPLAAVHAFATTTNRPAVVRGARVDHLVVVSITEWASHGPHTFRRATAAGWGDTSVVGVCTL